MSNSRAVGYVRVSDLSQVEGHSLDAQRTEITRWCHDHGHRLIDVYEDAGVSAYTDDISKRPSSPSSSLTRRRAPSIWSSCIRSTGGRGTWGCRLRR